MAWERRARGDRYYVRVSRVGGRVVRTYFGAGAKGVQAAQEDAERRATRQAQRLTQRVTQDRLDALEAPLRDVCDWSDVLVEGALLAAGYRKHHRGWRHSRALASTT